MKTIPTKTRRRKSNNESPTAKMNNSRAFMGPGSCLILLGLLLCACTPEPPDPQPSQQGQASTAATHGLGYAGRGLVIVNPERSDRPYYHRLGPISYGQRREHTFTFKNKDSEAITIQAIQPACACVRPLSFRVTAPEAVEGALSRAGSILTIPAGATADLTLRVDTELVASAQQNRDKLVITRMRCTSTATPFLMLELSFKVDRLFSLGRESLALGNIPANGGGGSEVNILTGIPGSAARVLAILSTPKRVRATLESIAGAGELHWQLTAELDPPLQLGPIDGELVLSTTDRDGLGDQGRLTIPFHGTVVPDVTISPHTLSFSAVPQGNEQQLEAVLRSLLPGQRLKVHSSVLRGPSAKHLTCILAAVDPDDRGQSPYWRIILTLGDTHPAGRIDAALEVQTNDPNYPSFSRPLTGLVRAR